MTEEYIGTFRGGTFDGGKLTLAVSTKSVRLPIPELAIKHVYQRGDDGVWVVTGEEPMTEADFAAMRESGAIL